MQLLCKKSSGFFTQVGCLDHTSSYIGLPIASPVISVEAEGQCLLGRHTDMLKPVVVEWIPFCTVKNGFYFFFPSGSSLKKACGPNIKCGKQKCICLMNCLMN